MKPECQICGSQQEVSEMTDGKFHVSICSECRIILVPLFYIYGTLEEGVAQVKLARTGTGNESVH